LGQVGLFHMRCVLLSEWWFGQDLGIVSSVAESYASCFALGGRLLSCFSLRLGFKLIFHGEFNLARPGRPLHSLSIGSSRYSFQDNAATIHTIACTRAMLLLSGRNTPENMRP
jgi:hypothetical protein